eukprot:CAMPEP_0184868490 /NCGR_PEP_ID=MMETSP0580-20130426/30615_1 /TAXON_ID=1118495 /ORGANISM="Dactyliosolen fragilissimus" /LENGTH=83 /DNA_ID=CAMNT_0027369417 /DNA_START=22 /DNA_END=269 /DNA_ORIENTATION=+
MNPGGDFGKRELSPALRSRFTEIWVPSIVDVSDIGLVLSKTLCSIPRNITPITPTGEKVWIQGSMMEYFDWFNNDLCRNPNST